MTSELHGAALVRDVVARAEDPGDPLGRIDALELVTPADVELSLHAGGRVGAGRVLASGVGASPGVATGEVVLTAEDALDRAGSGRPLVLVRPTTGPADAAAFAVVAGVVTSGGGVASHAAVLARGRGLPAVCGATSLVIGADSCTTADGTVVRAGDVVTVDGSSGEVRLGATGVDPADVPTELEALLAWADEVRAGSMGVQANADTAADARTALGFGAEGVGLCRIEHLVAARGGLPALRELIGAGRTDGRSTPAPPAPSAPSATPAARLRALLGDELEALLEVMDGCPVTVRLLDLPSHELFGGTDVPEGWREHDPMLGLRGARLLVARPDLVGLQVAALTDAVAARRAAGGHPVVRVMVPFVSTASELVLVRELVESALVGDPADPADLADLPIGAVVETPRAALRCADLARAADFLSFGTNDLTQLTFGLGRDDAGPTIDRYVDGGLLATDPFVSLDLDGVGELLALAVERARGIDPALEIGVCGEHSGDPASIAFLRSLGVDHISCSPYRVPGARLAAARALLGRS